MQVSMSVAESALAAKRLARRNQTRRNLVLLVGVLVAVLSAIAYVVMTGNPQAGRTALVVAVAMGSISGGLLLWRFSSIITPQEALCPSCGHSWEIKEGRSVPYAERMLDWDKCPGCALPIRTALLERIVKGARSDA
jgi:4-amino-4-deoxy-L-arabinose transferase-like glycosyltransferase